MDGSDFESSIGKPEDSPEVTALLKALKVTKALKAPKDGGDVDLKLAPLGLMLVFRALDPKSSKLFLFASQFYSSKEKGFKTFAGELPRGLTFSDKQEDAKKKLGKPFFSKKMFRFEKWKAGAIELGVNYSKEDGTISMVQFFVPV